MIKENVLKSADTKIEIKTVAKFDPAVFFVKRGGLYVWSNFTDHILSKAEPIKKAKEFSLVSFDLKVYANDNSIENELPKKHLFDESDVCGVIASLIEKQSNGEKGFLSIDRNYNLFYTPAFVVGVRWGDGGWYVLAWGRDGGGWGEDYRVFSPATERL